MVEKVRIIVKPPSYVVFRIYYLAFTTLLYFVFLRRLHKDGLNGRCGDGGRPKYVMSQMANIPYTIINIILLIFPFRHFSRKRRKPDPPKERRKITDIVMYYPFINVKW